MVRGGRFVSGFTGEQFALPEALETLARVRRTPRDGRAIEELGTYDPMVRDKDRRVSLNAERIRYWLSVGAQPSEKVGVLIKKYLDQGEAGLAPVTSLDGLLPGRFPVVYRFLLAKLSDPLWRRRLVLPVRV